MGKLLIIDGHNLLFQMFYGMPARIMNADGKPIGGTVGFVGALLKIIRMTDPTHIVAVFDGETKNARTDILPEYKANRPDFSGMPEEETPFSQLAFIYAALDFLGIRHFETENCEADDMIASYAQNADGEVVISSFDSDFFQLISERVSVLRYRGENTVVFTIGKVCEKFGIEPCVYADFKSLVGDGSDNIKGAPKVGPKTAAALIREYGSLCGVIENAQSIAKAAVRESVISNAGTLMRNYSLIKLDGNIPLPSCADELTYGYRGETTGAVLSGAGIK